MICSLRFQQTKLWWSWPVVDSVQVHIFSFRTGSGRHRFDFLGNIGSITNHLGYGSVGPFNAQHDVMWSNEMKWSLDCPARKGNKCEDVYALSINLGLAIPVILGHTFFYLWQTIMLSSLCFDHECFSLEKNNKDCMWLHTLWTDWISTLCSIWWEWSLWASRWRSQDWPSWLSSRANGTFDSVQTNVASNI